MAKIIKIGKHSQSTRDNKILFLIDEDIKRIKESDFIKNVLRYGFEGYESMSNLEINTLIRKTYYNR